MTDVTIRPAVAGEEGLILALLRELADYEKLLDVFHIDEEVVRRDYLSAAPLCHADLAFAGAAPVGIATWYWKYASFAARRVIHLEDLFVRPAARGHGHGVALLRHLAKTAAAVNGAVEWAVLDWNTPSIDFYERIGAREIPGGWLSYRLEGDAAKTLAGDA
jgi:GNAT superfamily N-acetyltransferase